MFRKYFANKNIFCKHKNYYKNILQTQKLFRKYFANKKKCFENILQTKIYFANTKIITKIFCKHKNYFENILQTKKNVSKIFCKQKKPACTARVAGSGSLGVQTGRMTPRLRDFSFDQREKKIDCKWEIAPTLPLHRSHRAQWCNAPSLSGKSLHSSQGCYHR